MKGNRFTRLEEMFLLSTFTPWYLLKCFRSEKKDSLAKLECLMKSNLSCSAAELRITLTSEPFSLNSFLCESISDKKIFAYGNFS